MTRTAFAVLALVLMTACAVKDPAIVARQSSAPTTPFVSPATAAKYGAIDDNGHQIAAVPPQFLSEEKARREVDYWTDEKPGTIIVDPYSRFLYHVQSDNKATRYAVAVGAAGYGFSGEAHVPYQRNWPSWLPTDNMIAQDPALYGPVAKGLEGGIDNPLGARALYLHNGQGDTFYRIHGTMDPASIGQATSAGCIRLFNQDIIHLAEQTRSMTKVIVLTEAEAGKGTAPPGQSPIASPFADPAGMPPDTTIAADPVPSAHGHDPYLQGDNA